MVGRKKKAASKGRGASPTANRPSSQKGAAPKPTKKKSAPTAKKAKARAKKPTRKTATGATAKKPATTGATDVPIVGIGASAGGLEALYFRTGDRGRVDEEGFYFITGRIKEQYKLENGKYVVPSPIEEQLQLSGYVTNIMVYGEQRPYNVAVIVPDMEALTKWAADHGLGDLSESALLESESVNDLYRREIDRLSGSIKGYEQVRDFVLEDEVFSPENGMLTPTLKVKRRVVAFYYGSEITEIYTK